MFWHFNKTKGRNESPSGGMSILYSSAGVLSIDYKYSLDSAVFKRAGMTSALLHSANWLILGCPVSLWSVLIVALHEVSVKITLKIGENPCSSL